MSRSIKIIFALTVMLSSCSVSPQRTREENDFNKDWKFNLSDFSNAQDTSFQDSDWRSLDLPHDWSIEGTFDENNPAGVGGGALPGGIGWYRKTFSVDERDKDRLFFIEFDGIYRNSEVWINGHYLGQRPNGYISFQYELTPYIKFGSTNNVVAVKVDNSQQPNSRWYSGSGIYRHVRLITTNKLHVDHWGTSIVTPDVSATSAQVIIKTKIKNDFREDKAVTLTTTLLDADKNEVGKAISQTVVLQDSVTQVMQEITLENPTLWSIENPKLYKAVSRIDFENKPVDNYETTFGIRYFKFDSDKGFSLNGTPLKIKGVCLHHDLGCLGSAVNKRAIERQLEIMKGMGVNGIRTSHNPPAPELLQLCDEMGFIVMDEAFDMWKKEKTKFDYHLDWDQWHKRDLEDQILRDQNHPSVFIWSIGNEIGEQWGDDGAGTQIAKELVSIVHAIDSTRPITTANNEVKPYNSIIASGALDLIGYNYHHEVYDSFPVHYPNQKFIATETISALQTRCHYDMPSDSVRKWPIAWDKVFLEGNPDNTVSAYDNVHAPWGSTHEETWKVIKKHDFLSGMFIWTGFDYIGEPTPYIWPSRSSYFGIVDLAGFPKDVYYMYKSEWTKNPLLYIFPHWNWEEGQIIDVWAYSNAEEVELFLNNESLGVKKKQGDDLHLMWRTKFTAGTLRAVARSGGKDILTQKIKTAGAPAKIVLEPDHAVLRPNNEDLSFVTVKIVDSEGNTVPNADNLVNFDLEGEGFIAGVDNGDPVSHESFKAKTRKAFHGLCLVVVQAKNAGNITLRASSAGLEGASTSLTVK